MKTIPLTLNITPFNYGKELERLHAHLIATPADPAFDIPAVIDEIVASAPRARRKFDPILIQDLKTHFRRWQKLLELKAPAYVADFEYHWIPRLIEALLCDLKGLSFELTEEESSWLDDHHFIHS